MCMDVFVSVCVIYVGKSECLYVYVCVVFFLSVCVGGGRKDGFPSHFPFPTRVSNQNVLI